MNKIKPIEYLIAIPNTEVTLLPWTEFNSVIKTLANGWEEVAYTWIDNNIESFERVNEIPTWVVTWNISEEWSQYPVYAWFSWWILYYTTQAATIQMNENSLGMFQSFGALTWLDLSSFDTSKVTNMSSMFW